MNQINSLNRLNSPQLNRSNFSIEPAEPTKHLLQLTWLTALFSSPLCFLQFTPLPLEIELTFLLQHVMVKTANTPAFDSSNFVPTYSFSFWAVPIPFVELELENGQLTCRQSLPCQFSVTSENSKYLK
jgi:hypothetical protein